MKNLKCTWCKVEFDTTNYQDEIQQSHLVSEDHKFLLCETCWEAATNKKILNEADESDIPWYLGSIAFVTFVISCIAIALSLPSLLPNLM